MKYVDIKDNSGNVLIPSVTAAVSKHDSILFPGSLKELIETAKKIDLPLEKVPLTLDSGFDSAENENLIKEAQMIPIIKPNLRNTKDKKIIEERTNKFKEQEEIYKLRHTIERSFAWEDKYRKLVIRYERLEATFQGFRYLAAALVNYRTEFGRNSE